MADSDKKIVFGSTFGVASFRQHVELTPYGNFNYSRFESHLGRELNTYIKILPIISERAIRWTTFWDGSFDSINGSAVNMGSRRYALFGRFGASIRFGTMDESELLIRARVGLGPSYNELNFGKGIVPSVTWGLAVQTQMALSFVHCISRLLCIGPQLGVGLDFSPGFTSSNIFIGFAGNGIISPPPRNRESDPLPPPTAPPQQIAMCPPVAPPPTPDVPKPQVTCPDPVKCPDPADCPKCKECPPPVECQKCQDMTPLVRDIAECKEEVRQIEGEKKQCQDTVREIKDTLREIGTPKYLVTVVPQRMILFQNDMVEIARLQQRFPGKGVGKLGKTNPTLDSVIRRVHAWMINIARLSRGLEKPAYTIDLTISGYANDTGLSTARNKQLANERTSAVISYLVATTHVMNPYGKTVPNLSGTNIIKVGGVPIVKINREYASEDPSQDIMRLLLNGNDPSKLDDIQRRQLESDAKNPDWRMAMIEYRIMKLDGDKYHEIPVEEFSETFSHTMKPGGE